MGNQPHGAAMDTLLNTPAVRRRTRMALPVILAALCTLGWLCSASRSSTPPVRQTASLAGDSLGDAVRQMALAVRSARAGQMDYGPDDGTLAAAVQKTTIVPTGWKPIGSNRFADGSGAEMEIRPQGGRFSISLPVRPADTCVALLSHDMNNTAESVSSGSWLIKLRQFSRAEAFAACGLVQATPSWVFY